MMNIPLCVYVVCWTVGCIFGIPMDGMVKKEDCYLYMYVLGGKKEQIYNEKEEEK